MAFGVDQYLATDRTALEISGRVDIADDIKPPTSQLAANSQFLVFIELLLLNSYSKRKTRYGSHAVLLHQRFLETLLGYR